MRVRYNDSWYNVDGAGLSLYGDLATGKLAVASDG